MKNISKTVSAEAMIEYLRSMMEDFKAEEARYGLEDRLVNKKLDALLACKEMVECMIGMPVNLCKDGKITIGF